MDKLKLLNEFIALQADDAGLWFDAEYASEAYLQQQLRRVAWLIEEATDEQIKSEIEVYKGRLINDY